jgi:hypothetical protein
MDENRPIPDDRTSFENGDEVNFGVTENSPEKEPPPMVKNQKIMLAVLGFLGIAVLVLAVIQMRNLIKIPWPNSLLTQDNVSPYFKDNSNTEDADVTTLKNKDTDADGISDYDELQTYKTSPYLADSDSDGFSDKEEIVAGDDPNCPKGQVCFSSSTGQTVESGDYTAKSVYVPTAAELRQLLLDSGNLTQEQLSQFSDADLIGFYQEMMKENPELTSQLSSISSGASDLSNYSASQIRQMLLEQGFDQATLDNITDDQLMTLYQDALQEAQQE